MSGGTGSTRTPGSLARSVACVVLVAVASVLMVGSPVGAVYPIPAPDITTDSSTYDPGGLAEITLTGFLGCDLVTITIPGTGITIQVVPNADGEVTLELQLPDEPGTYVIDADCQASDESTSTTILVEGSTPITPTDPPVTDPPVSDPGVTTTLGGNLPSTGSDTARPVLFGTVVLAAGVTFVLVARARRRPAR